MKNALTSNFSSRIEKMKAVGKQNFPPTHDIKEFQKRLPKERSLLTRLAPIQRTRIPKFFVLNAQIQILKIDR